MEKSFRDFDWNGITLKNMSNDHLKNCLNWCYYQITIHYVSNGLIDYRQEENENLFNHYVIEGYINFVKEDIYRSFYNINNYNY
jgi:hypothetical protein